MRAILRSLLSFVPFALGFSYCSAQGLVDFSNSGTFQTLADRRVLDLDGRGLIGTNWCAQLYFGLSATTLTAVPTNAVRFYPGTTTLHGTWNAVGAYRVLPGFLPSEAVTLQVKVWDGSRYPTFEDAFLGGGIYGQSQPFPYLIPAPGDPVSASKMENLRGFMLVPEPLPIVLWAVCVVALWLFRQRHQSSESRNG